MKKIPTIFERDWESDRSRVLDVPNPKADWVFAGEGVATIKLDGMCAMIRENKLYKRRELREGERPPFLFEAADFDEETGKTIGWVPVGVGPEDRYFREAFATREKWPDGTYELVGPKVQGGVEAKPGMLFEGGHQLSCHGVLYPHSKPPVTFNALRDWLNGRNIEGIVWHHPDGRMAKIKLRDFGLKREVSAPIKSA